MYVVYINLLYFLSIFLFTYNKNLLSPKKLNYNVVDRVFERPAQIKSQFNIHFNSLKLIKFNVVLLSN